MVSTCYGCFHSTERKHRSRIYQLDFIANNGFNFIRVQLDYNYWTLDFDYMHPDAKKLAVIDTYIEESRSRGLHTCLNLHRASGYCINNNDCERRNLWLDDAAQEGFMFLWEYFAKKYKGISSSVLSFDLLNEPPSIGQYSFTRERHELVMRKAIAAIRAIDPDREIVLDGIDGGGTEIPELADVGRAGKNHNIPVYITVKNGTEKSL